MNLSLFLTKATGEGIVLQNVTLARESVSVVWVTFGAIQPVGEQGYAVKALDRPFTASPGAGEYVWVRGDGASVEAN